MSQLPDKPCANPSCGKMLKPHEQFGANLQEPLCWTCHCNEQAQEEAFRQERIREIKLEISERRFDLDNDELDDVEIMDIENEIEELELELQLLQTPKLPANPVAQVVQTGMFGSKPQ